MKKCTEGKEQKSEKQIMQSLYSLARMGELEKHNARLTFQ